MFSVALLASFAAAGPLTPAPVNLGTAHDFVLLAKTGISASGSTSIVGDIGVSPVSATYVTGFGLIADISNSFSTSSFITGKIFAADYTDPTPAKMIAAVSDMETAYTDAAGRTLPDYTELYTGDLTGKTLTPGVYKWSTGVLIFAGGVTISGTPNDIWIFQIAENLELGSGAMVTLSGGAQVSNIFWQVAGQVTIGTTAAMKGIILCQTAIVMNTGAVLNGRAEAGTGGQSHLRLSFLGVGGGSAGQARPRDEGGRSPSVNRVSTQWQKSRWTGSCVVHPIPESGAYWPRMET
jgi:hypothetical protein